MVGIVILNYNNAEDTLNCLESIMQFNTYPAKIVIVDNGSTKTEIVKEIDTRLSGKYIGRYETSRGESPGQIGRYYIICVPTQ